MKCDDIQLVLDSGFRFVNGLVTLLVLLSSFRNGKSIKQIKDELNLEGGKDGRK